MANVIFNGPAREIAVKNGVLSLDAQIDLYSEWKLWVKDADNSKYLQAFRTTAGDPIAPGKEIAPYFFLVNNWRIRPHDADHTLVIEGNLYADPSTNDIILPTTGTFTVNAVLERAVDAVATITSGGSGLTSEQDIRLTATYQATGDTTESLEEVLVSQSFADGDLAEILISHSLVDGDLDTIITSQSLADLDLDSIISSLADTDIDLNAILSSQSFAETDREEIITSQSIADEDLDTIITSQSLADDKLDSILATGGALTPSQADMLLRLYEIMGLDPTKPLVVTPQSRTVSTDISQSITTTGSAVTVTRTI